jgi:hypothetical protein
MTYLYPPSAENTGYQIEMNKPAMQEAFNRIVRGLASQQWKRCLDPNKSEQESCVLNQGKPGFHCAISWLIPWDSQKHLANNANTAAPRVIHLLDEEIMKLVPNYSKGLELSHSISLTRFSEFLMKVQGTHDTSIDNMMERDFRDLAKDLNLEWPEDVE